MFKKTITGSLLNGGAFFLLFFPSSSCKVSIFHASKFSINSVNWIRYVVKRHSIVCLQHYLKESSHELQRNSLQLLSNSSLINCNNDAKSFALCLTLQRRNCLTKWNYELTFMLGRFTHRKRKQVWKLATLF